MNQNPDLQELWSNPSERVIFLFKSIHKIYRNQMCEKSRQYGFTGPQIGLIYALHKNPFSTLNELSQQLGLSKSTVSGIVDRLVSQEVVIREVPENNRRTVRLSLSPEFEQDNILKELMNKYFAGILKDASDEDMAKIICGLETLYTLIKNGDKDSEL